MRQNVTTEGYYRVSKREAKRRYEAGQTIRLIACNMSFAAAMMWGAFADAQKDRYTEVASDGFNTTVARGKDFDKVVFAFTNYNCHGKAGSYPAYYVKN